MSSKRLKSSVRFETAMLSSISGPGETGPSRNGRMERNFPVIPIFLNFRPTSFRKMSVPFVPPPGISEIFGQTESTPGEAPKRASRVSDFRCGRNALSDRLSEHQLGNACLPCWMRSSITYQILVMGFGHRSYAVVGCPNSGKRLNKWSSSSAQVYL